MVDHLHNFACIGMWVPFNEGWGQFKASAVADWLKSYDPTRPVDHASGWFDQGGRDFKSLHVYFKDLPLLEPEEQRALILSEFGGYSLKVDGHMWNPQVEFGYRKYPRYFVADGRLCGPDKNPANPLDRKGSLGSGLHSDDRRRDRSKWLRHL